MELNSKSISTIIRALTVAKGTANIALIILKIRSVVNNNSIEDVEQHTAIIDAISEYDTLLSQFKEIELRNKNIDSYDYCDSRQ